MNMISQISNKVNNVSSPNAITTCPPLKQVFCNFAKGLFFCLWGKKQILSILAKPCLWLRRRCYRDDVTLTCVRYSVALRCSLQILLSLLKNPNLKLVWVFLRQILCRLFLIWVSFSIIHRGNAHFFFENTTKIIRVIKADFLCNFING